MIMKVMMIMAATICSQSWDDGEDDDENYDGDDNCDDGDEDAYGKNEEDHDNCVKKPSCNL